MSLDSARLLSQAVQSENPHRTFVIVNGEAITASDFSLDIKDLAHSVSAGHADAVVDRSQLVVDAIDRILAAQRGRQLGHSLTDEQFASVLANIRAQNTHAELVSERELQSASAEAALRTRLERHMIFARVKLATFSGIRVPDDEITSYYEAHRGDSGLASLEQVREEIRRILITPERQAQEWEGYLESLRRDALIEWRSEDYARQYDEARAERVRSAARRFQ